MSDETQDDGFDVLQQVVSIVSAYVSHNAMRAVELPEFIGAVHASLAQLAKEPAAAESKPPNVPAVPIKRSISKDFIICLEDGKKFKSLRRHLSSCYNMTPDEYRAKWGLPSDYPMVAPAYSATRSQLARESGLGQIGRSAEPAADASGKPPAEEAAPPTQPVEDAAEPAPAEAEPAEAKPVRAKAGETKLGDVKAGEAKAAHAEPAEDTAASAEASEPSEGEVPKKAKRGRPKKVAA